MSTASIKESSPFNTRIILRALIVLGICALWVSLTWVKPPFHSGIWKICFKALNGLIHDVMAIKGIYRWAARSAFSALVPIALLWVIRPPWTLGMGKPRAEGWRMAALGWLIAAPVLIWLGTRTGVQHYYDDLFKPGGMMRLPAYAISILVEHMFIQGVVLGLALPSLGELRSRDWFSRADHDPTRRGPLAWFGLGLPWGERGISAWLGVPKAAWPAILASSLIFSQVHVGKDIGELISAVPGGIALAILTLRAGSVWPGVILHFCTALLALATMAVFVL